jgi:hypothetical protein
MLDKHSARVRRKTESVDGRVTRRFANKSMPNEYVEQPDEYTGDKYSVYLEGTTYGAQDWQTYVRLMLDGSNLAVLNPRQRYEANPTVVSRLQTEWKYRHLKIASCILCWFNHDAIAANALLSLGALLRSNDKRPVYVGVHPDYRYIDLLECEISVLRPDLKVVHTLDELAQAVLDGMPKQSV